MVWLRKAITTADTHTILSHIMGYNSEWFATKASAKRNKFGERAFKIDTDLNLDAWASA